jgi:hypothetical protein
MPEWISTGCELCLGNEERCLAGFCCANLQFVLTVYKSVLTGVLQTLNQQLLLLSANLDSPEAAKNEILNRIKWRFMVNRYAV